MASPRAVKKVATSEAGKRKNGLKTVKKSAPGAEKPLVAVVPGTRTGSLSVSPVVPPLKKTLSPVARTCPLVLDGEMDAVDFSPSKCLSCDEFDCRFCDSERGSGPLRSRLFACEESDDSDGDDSWSSDFDDAESEGAGEEEGDLF